MDVIKDACDQGVVIVAISQCARGSISATYAAGHSLSAAGVVAGADMTPEVLIYKISSLAYTHWLTISPQAALTKLSYLLSKLELTTSDVRKLMAAPLRGELTMSSRFPQDIPPGSRSIQPVLMQLFRLTSSPPGPSSFSPSISPTDTSSHALSAEPGDVTAPWIPTNLDTARTHSAILPLLIHVAAAKNDTEGIQFCIDAWDQLYKLEDNETQAGSPVVEKQSFFHSGSGVGSGVCNVLDTSGRSPLHTAVLNGSLESTRLLLQNGASVHSRDLLDHTVLYYVREIGYPEAR